jgi:hypothetical protein
LWLLYTSVRFAATIGLLAVSLWAFALSPLVYGYSFLPLNFGTSDLTWNYLTMLAFYFCAFIVSPVLVALVGDYVFGGRRRLERLDERSIRYENERLTEPRRDNP